MNMDLKKDLQSPYIPGKEQAQSKEYDNLKDEIGIKMDKNCDGTILDNVKNLFSKMENVLNEKVHLKDESIDESAWKLFKETYGDWVNFYKLVE